MSTAPTALQAALKQVVDRNDLGADEMTAAMSEIMAGSGSPVQVAAFLAALRTKGETVTEITAAAQVLRGLVQRVEIAAAPLLDIVGTGGDGASIFNVSTAAAFICAEAGAHVAKHGNRAVSSKSGAADVLEAAGVRLDLDVAGVAQLVTELRVGFLFAPNHHPAMRHAAPIRRELGLRTLFNLLGPLTNPAFAPCQLLGVYARHWVRPLAEVMRALGSHSVLVVHAADGLDEISIAAPTYVAELHAGEVREYTITPEQFGLERQSLVPLQVQSAAESLTLIEATLGGQPGTAADVLALNAGAALYVTRRADSLGAGVAQAHAILATGAARERLHVFAARSRQLAAAATASRVCT